MKRSLKCYTTRTTRQLLQNPSPQHRHNAGPGRMGSGGPRRVHTGPRVIAVRGPFTSKTLALTLPMPNSSSRAECLPI